MKLHALSNIFKFVNYITYFYKLILVEKFTKVFIEYVIAWRIFKLNCLYLRLSTVWNLSRLLIMNQSTKPNPFRLC